MISFGASYTRYTPVNFPLSSNLAVIAPYWDDIHLSGSRQLRYQTIYGSNSLISKVDDFISSYSNIQFNADWLLWAYWHDVCPYTDRNCLSHEVPNTCAIVMFIVLS